jgi:hypothetical protein
MLGRYNNEHRTTLNDLEQLPPEALRQIENFVAFIKTRYQPEYNQRQQETIQDDTNINSPV